MSKLTQQQVRDLAALEREMDAERQPFVVCEGSRWAVSPLVMDELGLVSGQTVSRPIIAAILEAQIASTEAEIASREIAG